MRRRWCDGQVVFVATKPEMLSTTANAAAKREAVGERFEASAGFLFQLVKAGFFGECRDVLLPCLWQQN